MVEVIEVPVVDLREGAFLTLVLLGWHSSASYPSQRSLNSKYHSKAKLQDVRGLALFLDTLTTSSSTMTTTSEVVMMQNQLPFVKLGSFSSFTGVLTRIQSRAWQRPLSSCSSLTTSSTWLAQRRLLPMTSKTSPSGLDFLTVGGFTWALHRPMVTLPPLAPKSVSSREKNLFSTSLFKQLVKKSVH